MHVNRERGDESVVYVEVKYVDVVYVNREGRNESVLYVEVKYLDVVYVDREGRDESVLYVENDRTLLPPDPFWNTT